MPGRFPAPAERQPRVAAALLLALLGLGALAGCPHKRPDCVACSEPDPILNGCPFQPTGMAPLVQEANVLFLSGGGSHGAWGAGVLYGWNEEPLTRPKFDLVTGISTGALQGPLVFLGRDEALKEVYTTTETSEVYKWRWFDGLFSNSLQDRGPLKELIDDHLDDGAVREVGNVTDRHLWLGTVNLDTAQFCSWDMVEIASKANELDAAGDAEKARCYRDLFRDVVFAASGAPIVAEPVEIDGDHCETGGPERGFFHVDGGTRLRVFAEQAFLSQLQANRVSPAQPKAWVIMNGKLLLHPCCVDDRILPIALRSSEILMSEAVFGNLYFLEKEMGAGWSMQLSRIPQDYSPLFANHEFDPDEMTDLFEEGRQWVHKTPSPWESGVPNRVEALPAGEPCGPCFKLE